MELTRALSGQERAENVKHIYRGKEIMCRYKYMDFDMGGVRVRLIEPENKSGGDPYSDALSKRGLGSII